VTHQKPFKLSAAHLTIFTVAILAVRFRSLSQATVVSCVALVIATALAQSKTWLPSKEWNFEFVSKQYLLTWIIPNFYFHVTTAYAILRHNGVEMSKMDYLGG